jgi:hypothetical protein
MSKQPKVSFGLALKLACIAAHAEELFSLDGREADRYAIQGLLADAEVKSFLTHDYMRVLLPLKRSAR